VLAQVDAARATGQMRGRDGAEEVRRDQSERRVHARQSAPPRTRR
jgi:hypothetical protein